MGLSQHCTGGELSSNRGSRSHRDENDIYWGLLDDNHRQRSPIEGKLELRLCNHRSHLRRSTKVWTVHWVYQERRAGDTWLGWQESGQGHRAWWCTTDTLVTRRPKTWGCCEKCLACWRSTQLVVTIMAYWSGTTYCPCQWQWDHDIRQIAS